MFRYKKLFFISMIILLSLSSFVFLISASEDNKPFPGCTSILVGKDASSDGSTMVTHSADCGLCDYSMDYIPAKDYEQGTMKRIYWIPQYCGGKTNVYEDSGVDISEVSHTYAYTRSSLFGFMNEHQVGIGESTVIAEPSDMLNNSAALLPATNLSILALERAKTAREAIQIMGELAEEYGYKNYDTMLESLSVSDPNEVWLFEIGGPGPLWKPGSDEPGAVWVAQRVPDDEIAAIANASRIGEINLDDPDHFMASPNIFTLAERLKLWDPNSGEPFSWKETYGKYLNAFPRQFCSWRVWDVFRLVNSEIKIDRDSNPNEWPFSIKPSKKVSVRDIMNIHRSTFDGSEYDNTKGLSSGPFHSPYRFGGSPFEVNGKTYWWNHPVGFFETEYTVIQQARNWLPDPIGGITWHGAACNKGTIFVPFYCGLNRLPDAFTIGNHIQFDRNMWWASNLITNWACLNWDAMYPAIKAKQDEIENQQLTLISVMDKAANEIYQQDPELARSFIADWTYHNAKNLAEQWWDFAESMIVNYNYLGHLGPQWEPGPNYPEEWLKMFDLDHDPSVILVE